MKNLKKALSMMLALVLCLSLAAPAFAAEEHNPLPELEVTTGVVPNDEPYKQPYDDAKEADKLDGEDLNKVNGEIKDVVNEANSKIDTANGTADKAAGDAAEALKGIDTETHLNAANDAANEANSYAEQAQDTSLTLDKREEAAANAAKAADAAKEAAKKADEQVEAAQKVLNDAQIALNEANEAYNKAVAEAEKLLEGDEENVGLKAQAQELIDKAKAKVESAKEGLTTAEDAFSRVEDARSGAWTASEDARIAAEAAAAAASGQQDVIDNATNEHSENFVKAEKETVDEKANDAINAKELENAAQGVVDAQTKVNDLNDLKDLTDEQQKLADAKQAYDEAEEIRKEAQTVAQTTKDTMKESGALVNPWLDNNYVDWEGHNYRKTINAILAGENHEWLTEDAIRTVISAAKNHGTVTQEGKNIVKLGTDLEKLVAARKTAADKQNNLDEAVKATVKATGAEGTTAQEVLDSLNGKIGAINTDGKYNEELQDLAAAIEDANQAVGSAKTIYSLAGGNAAELSDLTKMKEALEEASDAYTTAIEALNSAAGTGLVASTTTVEALKALKALKENVETAKSLIAEMERTKDVYDGKVSDYNTAKDAAESANNQYQAAKEAVRIAEANLNKASVSPVKFTAQELQALNDALEQAKIKLEAAEAAKDAADEAVKEAEKDAKEAEDAYNQAVADANEVIGGDTGSLDGTDTGDTGDTGMEIDDTAIPLSSGPVTRAQFVDYLWRHEGSPAAESELFADHEYAPAIAWALSAGLIDEAFQPDELVTVADVRAILGSFAKVFGTNAVNVADLTTLTGEDGEAVLNCDQVLAEFFGEEYVVPEDLEILENDAAA